LNFLIHDGRGSSLAFVSSFAFLLLSESTTATTAAITTTDTTPKMLLETNLKESQDQKKGEALVNVIVTSSALKPVVYDKQ